MKSLEIQTNLFSKTMIEDNITDPKICPLRKDEFKSNIDVH